MISMRKARLVLEPMSKLAGTLQLSAALQLPNGSEERLWWQLPGSFPIP
jgi:hypothetical protein